MATARTPSLSNLSLSCSNWLNGDGPRPVASLLATIAENTEPDRYGDGGVVTELEHEVASLLAKPAALFFPTGTMAQQTTLRVLADRTPSRNIAFHPMCHLVQHEEGAFERLHGLNAVPVGSHFDPMTVKDLANVRDPLAALLIELPQRDLGGVLPAWSELEAQVAWARERGAFVHLDGARLWEAAPFYARSAKKSPADIAGLFDTVYVSFYKGLGGLAGCCVAGETDVIEELSQWRIRHGGRMFMMWPYAASALSVLRSRPQDMPGYWRRAQAIARGLRGVLDVEVLPEQVRSPMMHLRLSIDIKCFEHNVRRLAREQDLWTFARPFVSEGPRLQRLEFQVGRATMRLSVDEAVGAIANLAKDR